MATSPIATQSEILPLPPIIPGGILLGEAETSSPGEYELLVALAGDPERVFKKEELLRDVWSFRSLGRTRTLDSHANRLRRKLNRSPETAYILDVWGVDYRLVATAG